MKRRKTIFDNSLNGYSICSLIRYIDDELVDGGQGMGLFDDMKKRAISAAGLDSDEARKNMDQLKASVSEIGKQLKESGKTVASQAHASAKKIQSEKTRSAKSEEADANGGILEHANQPVAPNEKKKLETIFAPIKKGGSEGSTASSDASVKSQQVIGRLKALPRPFIGIALAILVLIAIIFFSLIGSCSGGGETEESTDSSNMPLQQVTISVECEHNLLFSTYNVDIYADDQKLGTLEHGENGEYAANLSRGAHTLKFTKEGDDGVNGQTDIEVAEEGETFSYKIKCKSDRIEIEQLDDEAADEAFAKELEETANQPGEKASEVIQQLKDKNYEEAGYSLVCLEAESILQDFNAEDYVVEAGEVNSLDREITLRLESTKEIQPSFEKEIAVRVATVAMTNCWATDVFGSDGAYDPEKFHSFADLSGYYMTIEREGEWTGVNEATWHVEDMRLKASEGLCFVLSADVSFDGSAYIVSAVNVSYGNSFEDIESGDEWSVSKEAYEPSESLPFLTVSPNLVEKSRDEKEESAKLDEQAAEESAASAAAAEEAEYQSWVESHFSFWDGRCDELVDLVKSRLNDERSFEHIQTSYVALRDQGILDEMNPLIVQAGGSEAAMNDVVVIMDFSAKNSFNATIKSQAVGVIHYSSGDVELIGIA